MCAIGPGGIQLNYPRGAPHKCFRLKNEVTRIAPSDTAAIRSERLPPPANGCNSRLTRDPADTGFAGCLQPRRRRTRRSAFMTPQFDFSAVKYRTKLWRGGVVVVGGDFKSSPLPPKCVFLAASGRWTRRIWSVAPVNLRWRFQSCSG